MNSPEPDDENRAASTEPSQDPVLARQHLASACVELDAARRRWEALGEAEDACRRAREAASGVSPELDDVVESGIKALRSQTREDAIRAKEKALEALGAVESFGWSHRLSGNPDALVGVLLAMAVAALQLSGIWLLPDGWNDGLVRYLLIIVLLVALLLSRRGWARSYKRGKLPEEGEGVLPLRGAASAGKWVAAIGLVGAATPIVVDMYGALVRLAFNHELGEDYTGWLLPDEFAAIVLSESTPTLLLTGMLFVSVGVWPVGNAPYEFVEKVVTSAAGVGRWVWQRIRRRRMSRPVAER